MSGLPVFLLSSGTDAQPITTHPDAKLSSQSQPEAPGSLVKDANVSLGYSQHEPSSQMPWLWSCALGTSAHTSLPHGAGDHVGLP